MEANKAAIIKAALLTSGPIGIDKDFRFPFIPSRSTAGPGAGSVAIVLMLDDMRIKKAVTYERTEFRLVDSNGKYTLMRGKDVFVKDIKVVPTVFHAPEQAFFNLSTECIYDCKFCTSRKLDKKATKGLDADKIVNMIISARNRPDLKAVALTSAVAESPEATIEKMIEVIARVHEEMPNVPIGVEPYISSISQIDSLKAAGATEIKINMETFDPEIFKKVCGMLDMEWILECIGHACEVFGREKVTSNIIVGMGETDENVLEGVEVLAKMGCVATIRPLRINDINREPMLNAIGSIPELTPERLVHLAGEEKKILMKYGLTTLNFETMCHACRCCDIVPFVDV